MHKILFPEANNEFIKAAAAELKQRGICEPIVKDCDLETAGKMVADGTADAMVAVFQVYLSQIYQTASAI